MSYGDEDTGWVENPRAEVEEEIALDLIYPALCDITGQEDFYRGRGKDWRIVYSWAEDGNSLVALDPQAYEIVARRTYLNSGYIHDCIIEHLTEEVPEWVTISTHQPSLQ